MEIITR